MPDSEWILISYHVPTNPSAVRVATWRALRQQGAVPLGDGLYALPGSESNRTFVIELAERINRGGGSAISFTAVPLEAEDEAAMRLKFEAARYDEYRQVVKSAGKLVDHIEREEATEDFRLAEVDSLEEELNKVRAQLGRAISRDSVRYPARDEAERAIDEAATRLQEYVTQAFQKENQE